jgi:DNA topoisomerase I
MTTSTDAAVDVPGLVYVSDAMPGIRRLRHGSRFAYTDAGGRPVRDAATLERIARLAIPPAYEKVWICPDPNGHLQATGHDARGRKQYRYHPQWRVFRDAKKFERMPDFADALPRLRRRLRDDLALPGLPREKVLAVLVSLLDATRMRIGNAEYARDNDSYGLTTLRNRHVRFLAAGRVVFRFRGKGGADHEISVDDRRLARLVRRCHQLPGQRLFQFVDDAGELRPIDSGHVNLYLKEAMGMEFTAKDFRTWGATLRAAAVLHAMAVPDTGRAVTACIVDTVKTVAAELRNTPAVCRKSYINPLVFEAWKTGALHRGIDERIAGAPRKTERRVLAFLRREAQRRARASLPRRASGQAPRSATALRSAAGS